ncbi:MAG: hypothetical protein ACPGNV_07000 [Mangrovicoccus sp.]
MPLDRPAGLAALAMALCFVIGFTLFGLLLAPAGYGSATVRPAEVLALAQEHLALITAWNLVIYVGSGAAVAVMAPALAHDLIEWGANETLAGVSAAFGLIWAGLMLAAAMVSNTALAAAVPLAAQDPQEAERLWYTLHMVERGLGGGNELLGGLWIWLVSHGARRGEFLPGLLCALGVITAMAGFLTLIPSLSDMAGAAFGLGSIAWLLGVAGSLALPQDR